MARTFRIAALAILSLWFGSAGPVSAAPRDRPVRAVATFSILGDLVRQVGGSHVTVATLVGPDSDAHGLSPSPADARKLAEADIVFVNGLGLEGWFDRLIRASGTRAPVVVASAGVKPIPAQDEHAHEDGDRGHGHGHSDQAVDPHAWQDVANVRTYVANIRDGLAKVDPAHADAYRAAAAAYLVDLDALERDVRAAIARIPPERRRIITTHDAFGYFAAAYGLRFIAPQGVSTDSEASPRDVAAIIRQIRKERVPAVFLENISDPRQMQQIARESGARVGGKVYSDALSAPDGPAATYLDLMRSNLKAFDAALMPG
ncbi:MULTISPECIES: metal ABC transporter substrate-binding protein [unclassified Methylobacterium]|uniref:metal ABC transporter substrate-binding protein n=1 Tax=unclassified Methylobacterium TaxID=2615210 RepID=UPI000CDEE2FD|nr:MULTISPECIES: metal ABC transporter substrate-binding protein [unclassified Methylobacterium]MBN4096732.1 metal ABC transporter substrate-binding protein [Methylobacterium sp. OT2]